MVGIKSRKHAFDSNLLSVKRCNRLFLFFFFSFKYWKNSLNLKEIMSAKSVEVTA